MWRTFTVVFSFVGWFAWVATSAKVREHPTRVILGYSDTCNDSPSAALRKGSMVSAEEVTIIVAALDSMTVARHSVADRRMESLMILASLLSLRNNGTQSADAIASVAFNAEKLSKGYFREVQMEVIEDPEGRQGSRQLASLAKVLPCMQFAPEPDVIRPKEFFIPILPRNDDMPAANSTYTAVTSDSNKPNDVHFDKQWAHRTGKLPEAWNVFTGATKGIPVAVVDTGCSFHPDLAPNLWVDPDIPECQGADANNPKFAKGCYGEDFGGNGSPLKEVHEHGTALSGMISAATNNKYGVAGVCWNCKIACVKTAGEDGGTANSALVAAYDYIIRKKFKVSNHSYGGANPPEEEKAVRAAWDKMVKDRDHLAIVAAGNDNCNIDWAIDGPKFCTDEESGERYKAPLHPATDTNENVITVGAIDSNLKRSVFSNWGPKSVDLFAPGTQVYVLMNTVLNKETDYGRNDGTSLSSPFVAGVVAMIWGSHPELTPGQVKEKLLKSVTQREDLKELCASGGYVNAQAAIGPKPPLTDGSKDFPLPKSNQDFSAKFHTINYDTPSGAYSNAAVVHLGLVILGAAYFTI